MPAKRLAKSVAEQFGGELRKARKDAQLTQQALAEQAEIDPVFVSMLENGRRQPSLAVLVSLERVLGLAPGEMVHRVVSGLTESTFKPTAKRTRHQSGKTKA